MKTKIFTLVFALAASVGTIFAQTSASGTCGENANWELKKGTLYITGTGAINDYPSGAPWATYANEIEKVEVGNKNTKIGNSAFRHLTKLTSVIIGSSVTTIGPAAFEECSSLTAIYCSRTTPPTCAAATVFDGINLAKVTLNVPIGAKDAYKAANVWKDFGDNYKTYDSGTCGENATWLLKDGRLEILGSGAMYNYPSGAPWSNCKSEITYVYTGSEITEIGNSAFRYLNNVTTAQIGSSVTKIGPAAFEECSNLESLTSWNNTPPTFATTTVFDGINLSKVTVLVPRGRSAAYKAAEGWKNFTDIQPMGGFQDKKIYASVNTAGTTLTLDYNGDPSPEEVDSWPSDLYPNITKVVFNASMQDARPTSTAEWFAYYTKLATIEHLDYLNTSEVTDMNAMFSCCRALTSLDLSKFNTQKVTNMSNMFYDCEAVKELNVTNFDTKNVTNMFRMFCACYKLNVIDVTNFNTDNVLNMAEMFADCSVLKTINCNNDWSKSPKLTNSLNMFENCTNLVGGNGTKLDLNNLDATYARPDVKGQLGYFTGNPSTAIENPMVNGKCQNGKFIKDGQIYIQRGDKIFTITGARVK